MRRRQCVPFDLSAEGADHSDHSGIALDSNPAFPIQRMRALVAAPGLLEDPTSSPPAPRDHRPPD